jgi:hypothetical protein
MLRYLTAAHVRAPWASIARRSVKPLAPYTFCGVQTQAVVNMCNAMNALNPNKTATAGSGPCFGVAATTACPSPPPPSPPPLPPPSPTAFTPTSSAHHFDAASVVVTTVNGSKVITVPDTGYKKVSSPLSLKMSGLTSLINYAFVLDGMPSPSEDVINGLVVTGMHTNYTGGMTVKLTAKYTLHPLSLTPLVQGFSDNHYRCAAARTCSHACAVLFNAHASCTFAS